MGLITSAGYVATTLEEYKAQIETSLRGSFGQSIDLGPKSVFGQLVGIHAEKLAELDELAEAAYNARNPDANEGSAQEATAALTGTVKRGPIKSTVTLTLTGDDATVIPSGTTRARVVDTESDFVTTTGGTITELDAWTPATAYAIGERASNASRSYHCIAAGTSAGSIGPSGVAADETDGSVHWRYLGEGTAAIDIDFEAVDAGPINALSGTVTVIPVPISGWSSVLNLLDAVPGRYLETEAQLRVRREAELFTAGDSTPDAVRGAILRVPGVTYCKVYQNKSDDPVDGVPGHSSEAIVLGGVDQDIFNAMQKTMPNGIQAYGSTVGAAVDLAGDSQDFAFSRPEELEVYEVVTIVAERAVLPADALVRIAEALVDAGDAYPVGRDVTASARSAVVFSIPGVLEVPTYFIGTAPAPGTSNRVEVTPRQIPVFDSSRITLTISYREP